METKELKIQVPEGYEIDKEKSTFEKIVFKKVEKELPKSWEDLYEVGGWFVVVCVQRTVLKTDFQRKKKQKHV